MNRVLPREIDAKKIVIKEVFLLKKLTISLLVMIFMFGLAANSFAGTATKSANVSLWINGTEVTDESAVVEVDKGDTVNLSAITAKQGSSYTDDWKVNGSANTYSTTLNTSTGNYESATALNTATAGEFEIEYSIVMLAGKSSVTFAGGKKTNVTVVESTVSVKKITIKVKSVEARYASGNGNLNGYEATADGTIELTDGNTDDIDDFSFNYNKFANDKNIEIKVIIDGVTSTYELEIPFVAPGTELVFDDPSTTGINTPSD